MTVSISKMSVDYYLNQIAVGDHTAAMGSRDLTRYYTSAGAPPGRWLGSGLTGLALEIGEKVTAVQARRLLQKSADPHTGEPLGRPPIKRQTAPAGAKTPAGKNAKTDRQAVAGFDLTFSVPKSVSVLWALADEDTKAAVHAAHRQATTETLSWLEERVIRSRAGHAGLAAVDVRGIVATAFDHWDSRAGDPQLHTHVVIANRVQRTSDHKWVTLDSYHLHKHVVAASERFNAVLFDALSNRLGTQTEIRGTEPVDGDLPIAHRGARIELAGIDDALLSMFSTRSRAIEEETDRLAQEHFARTGQRPTGQLLLQLRQQATLSTRTAKDSHDLRSLEEKAATWRAQAAAAGFDPTAVTSAALDRSPAITQASSLDDEARTLVTNRVLDTLAAHRATFTRANVLAETARALAAVRCHSVADRDELIDSVTTAVLAKAVELTPQRYRHTPSVQDHLSIHGDHAFNDQRAYTVQATWSAEQRLIAAAQSSDGPTVTDHQTARTILDSITVGDGHHLASDQHAAALRVTTSTTSLAALIGPAGTGKTTCLTGVRAVWEHTHGPGSVVGLAPSAVAAAVLGEEIGIPTDNTAKWLWESEGPGAAQRAEKLHAARSRLTALQAHPRASATDQVTALRRANTEITALEAEQAKYTLRPGQLVVVDEASMAGTHALDRLREQAQQAGAKILAVGDPSQLGAVEAGGVLGWMERHAQAPEITTASLSSVWRFKNPWEAKNSLSLRAGDHTAADTLSKHGRVVEATSAEDVEHQAFTLWEQATAAGDRALLIASTQEAVHRLNAQAQNARITAGQVSHATTAALAEGTLAGVGDTILTRRNNRLVRDDHGQFIKNGDILTVTNVHADGTVTAHRKNGATAHLPRTVLDHTQLGYAATAHRTQGVTVDRAVFALDPDRTSRENFYVGMTRGKESNVVVVPVEQDHTHTPDPWEMIHKVTPGSAQDVLHRVLDRTDTELTAHEISDRAHGWANDLSRLVHETQYLTAAVGTRRAAAWVAKTHGPDALASWSASDQWAEITTAFAVGKTPTTAATPDDLLQHLQQQPDTQPPMRHGVLAVPPAETPAEIATREQLLAHIQQRLAVLRDQTNGEPWRATLVGRPTSTIDAVLFAREALGYTDTHRPLPAALSRQHDGYALCSEAIRLLRTPVEPEHGVPTTVSPTPRNKAHISAEQTLALGDESPRTSI